MSLEKKPFENIVTVLVQGISLFHMMFSTLLKTKIIIFVTFNCLLQMLSIWSGPKFCRLVMGYKFKINDVAKIQNM